MNGETKDRIKNILFDNFGSYVPEDGICQCIEDLEQALG